MIYTFSYALFMNTATLPFLQIASSQAPYCVYDVTTTFPEVTKQVAGYASPSQGGHIQYCLPNEEWMGDGSFNDGDPDFIAGIPRWFCSEGSEIQSWSVVYCV